PGGRAGVRRVRRVHPAQERLRRRRRRRPNPVCIIGPMRLGDLLVKRGVLSAADVHAGLTAQVLYGRRLGTNLVELGLLDLGELGAALAEQTGAPLADEERIRAADPGVRELVSVETARRCQAFPLGYEGDELAVAVVDPRDDGALATLAEAAGMRVRAYVAPEIAVAEALASYQ